MPRSRGGRSAPAPRQQTRSSSTVAAPPRQAAAPPPQAPPAQAQAPPTQASQGPGLFGQMASTAAGVAVGSAVGHTIANGVSSIFGGSSQAPVEQPQQELQQSQAYQQQQTTRACDVDARNFTKCLDENGGNMQICDWYLQQLKACQEASRSY